MPVHISISKARGTMALALFRQFLRDCLVHGRPLQHAAPVVEHARDPFGANTVSLDPLRKGEEVVSCSIAVRFVCRVRKGRQLQQYCTNALCGARAHADQMCRKNRPLRAAQQHRVQGPKKCAAFFGCPTRRHETHALV